MKRAVLLSGDLMLASAAHGAADRHGVQLAVAPTAEAAAAACTTDTAVVAIIDLRAPGLDAEAAVAALRSACPTPLRIIACGPHVHEASLARAAAAGCEVVTRGEFERRIDAALAGL